jgi:hypothetical protein
MCMLFTLFNLDFRELQRIVAERQDLEKRLIKGLHAVTNKANDLEMELMALKKAEEQE